jgi:hypothetical protein
MVFSPSLLLGLSSPSSSGGHSARHKRTYWSNAGTPLSWHTRGQVLVAQRNLEKVQEPIGSPACQAGKNLGSKNRPAFRRQKRRPITSQRHSSSPIKGETVSLRFREWDANVWAYMCMCLRVWEMAWLQNECWVQICGSMVNSYSLGWALTGLQVWGLYRLGMAKRSLNPCGGSKWGPCVGAVPGQATASRSPIRGICCTSQCVREKDPLPLLQNPLLLCVCLDIW